jgi:hypothetical protein
MERGVIMVSRVTFAFVTGVLVATLAIGGSGVAKDAQIGSAALTLPSPPGYCELSEQQPADARLIHVIGDLVAGAHNELLALSADCGQLDAWRAGKLSTLDDYAQYQTLVADIDVTSPRAESVKEICAAVRTEGEKSIAEAAPDLNARVNAAVKGVKVNEMGFLGVLAEDADACYFGIKMKARTEGGGAEELQLMISAATVVKGKIVFYNLYTLYHDAGTVTATLARHRRNVPALLAANGG